MMGILRCSPRDPEAKQVADYSASATWKVRNTVTEDWWKAARSAEGEEQAT